MAETEAAGGAEAQEVSLEDFESLLEKEFRPKNDYAKAEVTKAVRTLAEQALAGANLVPEEVVRTIKDMIASIDETLTEQINEILHHEEFQKMESAWRGLHFLVNRTETGTDLKIKVMNISKKELRKTLGKYAGMEWDQSPLFKKLYESGYGVLGGEPYGCIVGDYQFDHSGADIDILKGMGKIAASAHAPFITGTAPSLLDLYNWADIGKRKDLSTLFTTPPYAEWRALRESEDARYIGLALPRFLARRPYGKNNPVDEFEFEEETNGADDSKFAWANSAYAMAANITRAHKLYGWCSRIRGVESGGAVEDLPTHSFPTEKGTFAEQCPTEVSITDRREMELANLGLMPLIYKQNSNMAAFIGAQSLHQPAEYDNPDATKNAHLGARLPYIFACSRFAHYLKHMVRNKVGSYMEREDMQKWLGQWIQQYVNNQSGATDEQKARRPLAAAEVKVDEDPENPGMYSAKFFLRPHYQLEGVNVSLRLVSKLPSEVGG
jgi:type VI secretion system protein ImpC